MSDLLTVFVTLCKILGASMIVGYGFTLGAIYALKFFNFRIRFAEPIHIEWESRTWEAKK